MEIVHFFKNDEFYVQAEESFQTHKRYIEQLLPYEVDIQHVGSSAIPGTLTKGDLDIQIRVPEKYFSVVLLRLGSAYDVNEGSIQTDTFRAFKNDSLPLPLGIQLTVIGSEFDFFYKFRDIFLEHEKYRIAYDELKLSFEGKPMENYRKAKQEFFESLMNSPVYT